MKYKNIIMPIILLIVFIIICIISYGKNGNYIYDGFREAIVPESILQGKVLYKDILCLFPPLGYYFNALLFKIFGCKLIVLYISSVICVSIILSCVYKIMKEISDNFIAFITTLTIMLIFVSRIHEPDSANWFFVYSYSFIYALSFAFLSITSLILHIKTKKINYIYWACICLGISIAFKYDYLALSLILLFFLIKTHSIKTIINGIILFFIPTIITFGSFMLFTGSDSLTILKNEIIFLNKFANNELLIHYNKTSLPQSITPAILNNIGFSFLGFIKSFISLFFIVLIFYIAGKPFKGKLCYIFMIILICFVSILFHLIGNATVYYFLCEFDHLYIHLNFVFLPYFILISAILLFIYKKITKTNFTSQEKLFYILIPIAYAIAFRNYAAIFISNIGNFTILIFWMLFIYLFMFIVPNIFTKLNNKTYKFLLCSTLILYSLTFTYQYLYIGSTMKNKIEYPKGYFYVSDVYYPIIEKSLNHAEKNIKEQNKSLLYIEEGMYVNYFLDIPFIDMHIYALNSHDIPAMGENYIINIIKSKKPDYIYNLIPPKYCRNHGIFGIAYAKEIYKYILDNYNLESITYSKEDLLDKCRLEIYKKKD